MNDVAIEPPRVPGLLAPAVAGLLLVTVGLGGFVWWAATAQLAAASVAPGVVVVESKRRTIQHFEGGIAAEIRVSEGQSVAAGELLMRVANVEETARRDQLVSRRIALMAEISRLRAEIGGASQITFPADLVAIEAAREAIALQRDLFALRRQAHDEAASMARSTIAQKQREIEGIEAQRTSRAIELRYLSERLAGMERIAEQGFVAKVQLDQLRGQWAGLEADVAQLNAAGQSAEEAIRRHRQELRNVTTEYTRRAAERLEASGRELAEVEDALKAAADVVHRTEIVSPIPGRVVGLTVTTEGAVIPAGETLMEIVPDADTLTVEALIRPEDIDVVHPGLPVDVRLSAYSFRQTQPLPGVLEQVSADRIVDGRTGAAVYKGMVRFDEATLEGRSRSEGITLYPGMPAEIVIRTGERTLLDYLLSPVLQSMSRAFLET